MTAAWGAEPSGHSDTDLFAEHLDTDERPADIRGQHVSPKQWTAVEDVQPGEWL